VKYNVMYVSWQTLYFKQLGCLSNSNPGILGCVMLQKSFMSSLRYVEVCL